MQSSSYDDRDFCPFVVKTIQIQGSFYFRSVCYNENQNIILVCPFNHPIQFYDAITFEPQIGREAVELDEVWQISPQPETDIYILGCHPYLISTFNISKNELKKVRLCENSVQRVAFLGSTFYAFLLAGSEKLYIEALNNESEQSDYEDEDENVFKFGLKSTACDLHYLNKRKMLFVGLDDGLVKVYRTNKAPLLQMICKAQTGQYTMNVQSIDQNGKEYLLTSSEDYITVKIWHLVKGRMKLLKYFRDNCGIHSVVYLERYKMIAIASNTNSVKFYSFPCMKLEKMVSVSQKGSHFLFLMKDKNMIGVTRRNEKLIEFIQLGQVLEKKKKEDK